MGNCNKKITIPSHYRDKINLQIIIPKSYTKLEYTIGIKNSDTIPWFSVYDNSIILKFYPPNELGNKYYENEIKVYETIGHLSFIINIFDIDQKQLSLGMYYHTRSSLTVPCEIVKYMLSTLSKYGIHYKGDLDKLSIVGGPSQYFLVGFSKIPMCHQIPNCTEWSYDRG